MAKLFRKDAKEILAMVNTIPAPKPLDIERAKVAAITCKTTKEFCDFLNLDIIAFKHWCVKYADYEHAVMSWRSHATNEVEVAMAKRAIGFTKTTKRDVLTKLGTVETLHVETYYPPSETAGQFWLKNRKPQDWQDKKEIDVNLNANIRAWLVSAGGQLDPSEIIDGVSSVIETEVIAAELEDNSQQQLEAELISDLIEEVNTEANSDFNKLDIEEVSGFNLVVNKDGQGAAVDASNSNTIAPTVSGPPKVGGWSAFNSKWD